MATSLQAIRYSGDRLEVLDQLRLPHEHHYDLISTAEEAFDCIKSMKVRGAPAIAIVAVLALVIELKNGACNDCASAQETMSYIDSRLDYLHTSRPTAVNLGNAITTIKSAMRRTAATQQPEPAAVIKAYLAAAEQIFHDDVATNLSIGDHGAAWLAQHCGASPSHPIAVLTHCNTGAFATAGHGTALGIIRTLHAQHRLSHAFCTETRPYNQGGRLTAFELVFEGISSTLITDSMAGALLAGQHEGARIAAIIVGADRVVRNGDTANKVGTYALAVLARHHSVKFVVAAPTTSIDLAAATGAAIRIEARPAHELTQVRGAIVDNVNGRVGDAGRTATVATAHQGIAVWNPAFDVTPRELIDAIMTEKGVVEKNAEGEYDLVGLVEGRN